MVQRIEPEAAEVAGLFVAVLEVEQVAVVEAVGGMAVDSAVALIVDCMVAGTAAVAVGQAAVENNSAAAGCMVDWDSTISSGP